jgi:uncharacterized membrane protein YvbJ
MTTCELCGMPKNEYGICESCGAKFAIPDSENIDKLKVLERRGALQKRLLKFIKAGGLTKIGIIVVVAGAIIGIISALIFIIMHQGILLPP